MFDDGLDHVLDDLYGEDELGKVAARADLTAMHDHSTTDATAVHELIARKVWHMLRRLGINGGRMLTIGQDPETFAGVPADERRLNPGEMTGLAATIPPRPGPVGLPPHPGLRMRAWDRNDDPSQFDVVIAVPIYSDVALHGRGTADKRRIEQIMGVVGCLANTEPGGFTVALTARDVLDDPDAESRRLLAEFGELVGAVRLPSGALRPANPGNDAVVDLLVLRRHYGHPIHPPTFLPAPVQRLSGHEVTISQYFRTHPKQVLGRLDARGTVWGVPEVVVHPTGLGLNQDLTYGLGQIVERARRTGLTANTDHSVDLDAPIEHTLAHHDDLDTVRQRIEHIRGRRPRAARPRPASPDVPEPPPQPRPEPPSV